MAKYAFFFSYTSDAWARMINSPGDRTAAVRQLADSVGGSVESVYWMLGTHYGILIADVPDSVSAAALSIAVTSTGAFKNVQTHELLTQAASQSDAAAGQGRGAGLPSTRPAGIAIFLAQATGRGPDAGRLIVAYAAAGAPRTGSYSAKDTPGRRPARLRSGRHWMLRRPRPPRRWSTLRGPPRSR